MHNLMHLLKAAQERPRAAQERPKRSQKLPKAAQEQLRVANIVYFPLGLNNFNEESFSNK